MSSDGQPLELEMNEEAGSSFAYELLPHGVFQATLTADSAVSAGYAVVTGESGRPPAGAAIFQLQDGSGYPVSEAGVLATRPTRRARVYVDTVSTQTGVAIASPGNPETRCQFNLLDRAGFEFDLTARTLPARLHRSDGD